MAQPITIGRHKKKAVQVDAATFEQWQIDGYQRAVGKATRTGFQKAAQVVKKQARRLAPRASGEHRVVRTYPSGYKSSSNDPDQYRLSDNRGFKVKAGTIRGTNQSYYAYVSSKQGYSIFQEYGTRNQRGESYLRPALDESKSKIIPMLRAEWPK